MAGQRFTISLELVTECDETVTEADVRVWLLTKFDAADMGAVDPDEVNISEACARPACHEETIDPTGRDIRCSCGVKLCIRHAKKHLAENPDHKLTKDVATR